MTRVTSALPVTLAVALGVTLGGCESTDKWFGWLTTQAPTAASKAQDNAASERAASPPATSPPVLGAGPPPAGAPVDLPGKPPAVSLRNDPMVLKKALQDGEAAPVSLPREAMVRLFRTLEVFQPTAQQLQIIEAYGRQLAGPEQARLRYELQSCHQAPACVVVPQR